MNKSTYDGDIPIATVVSVVSAPTFQNAETPSINNHNSNDTAWNNYCARAEVNPEIRTDLRKVIENEKIVLLLDDSGSMQNIVRPPGSNPFTPCNSTRWTELMGDTSAIIDIVTTLNPAGIDIHFMNRTGRYRVTDPTSVSDLFNTPPSGGTPMIRSLMTLYEIYMNETKNVLIVLITDGEPTDGKLSTLFDTLVNKPQNFYISMVECNDNEEEMEYLTGWDTQIARFHNQEDYGEELNLIRRVQGPNTKFTRANYIQMTLLSPFYPKYCIDIRAAAGKRNPFDINSSGANYSRSNYLSHPEYQYDSSSNKCCLIS